VVVTFDEDGLYWHPDHVAVHERATAVVAALGAAAPALRYVSMPEGAVRALVDAAGGGARRPGMLGVADVDAFGAAAPPPSLIVDASAVASRKLAALRCHRTQVEGSALDLLPERDAARFLGIEHYREAAVGAPGGSFLERFAVAASARSG
jgi:N-acetyl-1-D-myo-inositol-2-amino-2-deoxy-alpha-D-glucopyranoside deacetylase